MQYDGRYPRRVCRFDREQDPTPLCRAACRSLYCELVVQTPGKPSLCVSKPMKLLDSPGSLLLVLTLAGGCGSAENPPPSQLEPVAIGVPVEAPVAGPVEQPREPEPSLRERWRAPFAVSSSGEVEPRRPRQVVVLGADPAIAEALARADPAVRIAPPAPPAEARPEAEVEEPDGVTVEERVEERRGEPERESVERVNSGPVIHRIRSGETWFGIATRYGVAPQVLERANPGVDPGRMRVGQLLEIPAGSTDRGQGFAHRVRAGETLWGIARQYGVSLEALREINDLEDDRLRLDQTLLIPLSGAGR